jgi:Fe-S oxidoreductase
MKLEDATIYTAKCFNGEPASCSYACPFRLDLRSFLDKMARGRWSSAYKTLRDAVVFPAIVAAFCHQPCRAHCQRAYIGDEALMVRDLESACIRFTKSRKSEGYAIPPKSKSVAVVGAGLAGLSFALNLSKKRYRVAVFEKEEGWGGALRSHKDFGDFDEDIALQFSSVETEFHFNREIRDLKELSSYDAIYIATGEGGETFGMKEHEGARSEGQPYVFMGGALCGASLIESIAQGTELSKIVEIYLETGKVSALQSDDDIKKRERYLAHDGEERKPRIEMSDPEGYTQEEAKAEASRCFQCDCDACERSCEMLKRFKKKPHRIAVEVFTDMQASSALSSRTLTRETYSCNLCGHCKSVCPEDVDIGALLQYSRTERLKAGKNVPAYHDYWLREMDFAVSEGAIAFAPKGKTCAYAFFPGCQLGAYRPEHVLRSYAYLSERLDAGIVLSCCGAPAYWAGDMDRFTKNADQIKKQWREMGEPTFVFACATCETLFELHYPEIQRVSLYELLASDKALEPKIAFDSAAVFDPCNARNDLKMQESVRILAEKAGSALTELKEKNRCCGYGGQMRLANPALYEEITDNRARADENPYIVYCANCRAVFASRDKDCVHILDMVFDLEPLKKDPTLQQKRENSLEVKKTLMEKISGEPFQPETHPWDDITLLISEEVQAELEDSLISAADVAEAIWLAETTGDKFIDESDGMIQTSMVKPVLTYWVRYKPEGPQTYKVISAYYHRMRFIENR